MNVNKIVIPEGKCLLWLDVPTLDRWMSNKELLFPKEIREDAVKVRIHLHKLRHLFPSPHLGALEVPILKIDDVTKEIAAIIDPLISKAEAFLKGNYSKLPLSQDSSEISRFFANLQRPIVSIIERACSIAAK